MKMPDKTVKSILLRNQDILSVDDLKEISRREAIAESVKPENLQVPWRSWKLTQQLGIFVEFVMEKLEKMT